MTKLFRTTAMCTLFAASPALADITVDDAWATWKTQMQALGLTMEASETRDGDALQIGEVRLSVKFPQDSGSGYLTFDGPRFVPASGGTVEVHFPENSKLTMGGEMKNEGSFAAALNLAGTNSPGLMSGDPNNVKTVWNGSSYEATLMSITINGTAAEDVTGKMTMGPFNIESLTNIGDALVTITSKSKMDSYDLTYAATIKEASGEMKIEAGDSSKGVTSDVAFSLPKSGLDVLGLDKQLMAGLSLVLKSSVAEQVGYQNIFQDGRQISKQDTKVTNNNATIKLDKAGFDMTAAASAFSADMLVQEMPLPIALAGTGVEGRMLLPLLKSEEPQPAEMKMALNGVTISEQLWGLFDPAGNLPRDPMTIAFDLSGDAKLLFNFLDVRALMGGAQPAGLPATVERVKLNSLMVKGVGAELTGAGEFTFDYTDWATFGGMPAPDGKAAFTLKGANGLMDKLVTMGMLTEQDTMGARMMMGMFAKPGEGEDVLTTEIEVKKTGEVSANGQRLR